MTVSETQDAGVRILALSGTLDFASADAAQERLLAAVGARPECVLVDLAGVTYLGSAGLRVLLAVDRHVKGFQGVLALVAPEGNVRQVLDLAGLGRVIPTYASRAAAVERLAGRGQA